MSYSRELKKIHTLFNSCSSLFIALGDEVRQSILLDIADAGEDGINVTNLSAKSNLSRPAVSHHLKVLKDSKIIKPCKKGTQIFYYIDIDSGCFESIAELVSSLQLLLRTVHEKKLHQNK